MVRSRRRRIPIIRVQVINTGNMVAPCPREGLVEHHGQPKVFVGVDLWDENPSAVYSIVWLHSYSCPDLLGFCPRMRSTYSLLSLYSCLFPSLSQLATASGTPISCVFCVRVCARNRHNTPASLIETGGLCLAFFPIERCLLFGALNSIPHLSAKLLLHQGQRSSEIGTA